jgi:hypothetical protein
MTFIKKSILILTIILTISSCGVSLTKDSLERQLDFSIKYESIDFIVDKQPAIQEYFHTIDFTDLNILFTKTNSDELSDKLFKIHTYIHMTYFYSSLLKISQDQKLSFYNDKKSYQGRINSFNNFYINNESIRYFSKIITVLLIKNEDNELLKKITTAINNIKESEEKHYDSIISKIKNKKYIKLEYLYSIQEDILNEKNNVNNRPLIEINTLISNEEIIAHINLIYSFDEMFRDQKIIDQKIKEFQIETVTFSKNKFNCFSHTKTELSPYFDLSMNILFESKSIDTDVIDCSFIPKK